MPEELIALLLANPQVKAAIENAAIEFAHLVALAARDLLFHSDENPNFKTQYLAESANLLTCKTPEEKELVLQKLALIRASASTTHPAQSSTS
jgi:hypothetical protein